MIDDKDDTFLARWLNNDLSEEELAAFKSSPDYPVYEKILAGTEDIQPSDFDEDKAFTRLSEKRKPKEKAPRAIHRQLLPYGIAAAIALLVGFFVIFSNPTTVQTTGFSEQVALLLPDGSNVTLNSGSEASFKKRSWDKERTVSLHGEALFEVKKGSTFTVATPTGEVTVLGTVFNVKSVDELLEVACFEGKVRVVTSRDTLLLTKGMAMRLLPNQETQEWDFAELAPGWTKNESSFRSMPARYVLDALQKQFDIQFEKGEFNDEALFTGSFPHDDLEVALRSVFGPLQTTYMLKDDRTVVLNK